MKAGISLISLSSPKGTHPGESLVLHRDGVDHAGRHNETFVIDLGIGSDLGEQAAVASPSIVVLTHDDQDHIGGWDSFAKIQDRSTRKIKQLWVPAEWGYLAVCALQVDPPSNIMHGNIRLDDVQAKKLALALDVAEMRSVWSEERYMAVSPQEGNLDGRSFDNMEKTRAILDGSKSDIIEEFEKIDKKLTSRHRSRMNGKAKLPSSQDSASRTFDRWRNICEILTWCGNNNIRVRFFSTRLATHWGKHPKSGPWRNVGIPEKFTIANAAEVNPANLAVTNHLGVAYYVSRLTAQNRLALTPYLHGNHESGGMGIMVWSDSAGEPVMGEGKYSGKKWDLTPWDRIGVMTAPHHGSTNKAHDRIWEARSEECKERSGVCPRRPKIAVVVAGTKKEQDVHSAVKQIPKGVRCCNRCRHVEDLQAGHLAMVTVTVLEEPDCPLCPNVHVFPAC